MRKLARSAEPLVTFALESVVHKTLPVAGLVRIAQQSWQTNSRLGITGTIEHRGGRFRVVIEGETSVVLPVVSRILADCRHTDIRVLDFGCIDARRYGGWSSVGFGMRPDIAPTDTDVVVAFPPRPVVVLSATQPPPSEAFHASAGSSRPLTIPVSEGL